MEQVRILMGTLDGGRWLQQQLDSFLAQSWPNWTLWVSDDGSQDETSAVLERFAAAHPGRLERRLEGPRRGSAANYLHLLCHPDLPPGPVALSDQDDVWKPAKLERAMAALSAGEPAEAGGAGGDAVPRAYAAAYLTSDRSLRRQFRSASWPLGPQLRNAAVQNIMSGHTTTLNRAALAAVRRAGEVPVPHHDWWIYLLMTGIGAEITIDPEPMVFYRQHTDATFGARRGLRAALRRASNLSRRSYGSWVRANLAALQKNREMLTPEARALIDAWAAIPHRAGPGRVAAFRRLGLRRQAAWETGLLHAAAGAGLV